MVLDDKIVTKIIKVLKEVYPSDLSIEEIAKKAGIHRNTAAKYLAALLSGGKVELRRYGKLKLFRIKGK